MNENKFLGIPWKSKLKDGKTEMLVYKGCHEKQCPFNERFKDDQPRQWGGFDCQCDNGSPACPYGREVALAGIMFVGKTEEIVQ